MSPSARFLMVCLSVGCVLRALLAWLVLSDPAVLQAADQATYLGLADLLRAHWDFGVAFGAERVPGYPVFLALAQAVTGSRLAGPVVLQNLVGGLAVWACWKLGRLLGQDEANLAGGLAALNLNMAVYANQMLTEALFLPLFAWGLYWLCAHAVHGRTRHLALFSLAFGITVLVRPVGMYLPLFLVPWLVLRPGGGKSGPANGPGLRCRAAQALLFLVLFAAALAPWSARNLAVYGRAGLTAQGEAHLVGWVVSSVARFEEGLDQTAAVAKYAALWQRRLEAMPEAVRNNPFARSDEAKRFTVRYLLAASPLSTARAWFWGAVRNLFVPVSVELAYILDMDWSHFSETPGRGALEQAWNFLVHNSNGTYVAMLALGLVLTLALRAAQVLGAVALWRRQPGVFLALCLMAAYFLAVSGPVGYAKYRLPYEPAFVLALALVLARLPVFRSGPGAGEGGRA